jgi:hypothetical protein
MNTITTASLTNGSTATASTSTILAIDLGKYKSVACLHDPDSGEFHRRFITAATLVLVLVHLNGRIDHCQAPLASLWLQLFVRPASAGRHTWHKRGTSPQGMSHPSADAPCERGKGVGLSRWP